MNRAVLRPHDTKFAYVAFGKDELRQVGLLVLLFLVTLAVLSGHDHCRRLAWSCPWLGDAHRTGRHRVDHDGLLTDRARPLERCDFSRLRPDLPDRASESDGILGSDPRTFLADLRHISADPRIGRRYSISDLSRHPGRGRRVDGGNMFSLSASPNMSSLGAYFTAAGGCPTRPERGRVGADLAGHADASGRDLCTHHGAGRPTVGWQGDRLSAAPDSPSYSPIRPRDVAAAVVGNALEFYDFTIYAFFAVQIGHSFFPNHSPFVGLMCRWRRSAPASS